MYGYEWTLEDLKADSMYPENQVWIKDQIKLGLHESSQVRQDHPDISQPC